MKSSPSRLEARIWASLSQILARLEDEESQPNEARIQANRDLAKVRAFAKTYKARVALVGSAIDFAEARIAERYPRRDS